MRFPRHFSQLIRRSPDPDRAEAAIGRLLEKVPAAAEFFLNPEAERAADRLVKLLAVSHAALRYILDDPSALDAIAQGLPSDPTNIGLSALGDTGKKAYLEDSNRFRRDLLRYKRREWIRTVASDLAGEASLEECTANYSRVANDCICRVFSWLGAHETIAVMALGKLGGFELNYSSDVDLIFVSSDHTFPHASRHDRRDTQTPDWKSSDKQKIAPSEKTIKTFMRFLSGDVQSDRILLVDVDLRPEGKSGPLVRSISSYDKYWSTWAEPWEIQSLIKLRPISGPEDLLSAFVDKASTYLWPETLDAEAIKAIRHIKRRTEAHAAMVTKTFDIKRSSGGIRDVEMAVQLLQLIHGRHDEAIRCANTLEAVSALEEGGYVSSEDAAALRDSYVFLRSIEHRLQVRNDTAKYDLPKDRVSVRVLAKSMGFFDTKKATAEERFEETFTSVTAKVRELHRRLFFRPLLEAFAALPRSAGTPAAGKPGAKDVALAEERLRALGFRDIRQARAGLEELTKGISRKSRLMAQLMPLILEWLSEAPDPSAGLTNLRKLVDAVGDQVVLVSTFRDNPAAVQRLCKVLGTSKIAAELLIRTPEHIHAFADDHELFSKKDAQILVEEARRHASWRSDYREVLEGTLRFCNRELLRVATRDLLSNDRAEVETVARELCGMAQGAISVVLDALAEKLGASGIPFCVVGLGSFGAEEMTYSSDIDVMFLYDHDPGSSAAVKDAKDRVTALAHSLATTLLQDLKGLGAPGPGLTLDADLRPEGRAGSLARSLDSAVAYYTKWADTWEFQALAKARPVAGDTSIFERFIEKLENLIWPSPFPESRKREIRLMKARVEKERGAPRRDERRFDLKLGPGGLTDVQFLVELLSLKHGHEHHDLRSGSTIQRLRTLSRLGLLPDDDASRLEEAYLLCTQIRNRIFLVKGHQVDSIPSRPEDAVVLAESLGYIGHPRSHLIEDFRRTTRRARVSFEKLFYSDL